MRSKYCVCLGFTPQLVEETNLEVISVSLIDSEPSCTPWLAGPLMVLEAGAISERILSLKEQNKALRCFILNNGLQTCKQVEIESELLLDRGFREVFEAMQWLVIKEDSSGKFTIGPNGKTLILSNAVQQHDSEAYAYTPEKRVEFDEQRYEKTIYFRWKDFLMDRSGSTVEVSNPVGKDILLFFSSETFLRKMTRLNYNELREKDEEFEESFVSGDCDGGMYWYALPHKDYCIKFLILIGELTQVVARTVTTEAIKVQEMDAYPFTKGERVCFVSPGDRFGWVYWKAFHFNNEVSEENSQNEDVGDHLEENNEEQDRDENGVDNAGSDYADEGMNADGPDGPDDNGNTDKGRDDKEDGEEDHNKEKYGEHDENGEAYRKAVFLKLKKKMRKPKDMRNNLLWKLLKAKDSTDTLDLSPAYHKKNGPYIRMAFKLLKESFHSDCISALKKMVFNNQDSGYDSFFTVILEKYENVLSAACFRLHFGAATAIAEIPFVATTKEHMKKGYGKTMVERLEGVLRSVGVSRILLPATEDAEPFWEKLGFQRAENFETIEYTSFTNCKLYDKCL